MEEIYKLALTDNPVDLVVDKNLKVSSSINTTLPEKETFLVNFADNSCNFTVPENVNIVKVYFAAESPIITYIKVTPKATYNLSTKKENNYRHLKSQTGIDYSGFSETTPMGYYTISISYSASINKETNIYNSDYINDDNYIYYYVTTGARANDVVTTKHQVTKNTTWQQAIDSGQNYARISFNENGMASCRKCSTLIGAMNINDIIKSDEAYGFYEIGSSVVIPDDGIIISNY